MESELRPVEELTDDELRREKAELQPQIVDDYVPGQNVKQASSAVLKRYGELDAEQKRRQGK